MMFGQLHQSCQRDHVQTDPRLDGGSRVRNLETHVSIEYYALRVEFAADQFMIIVWQASEVQAGSMHARSRSC